MTATAASGRFELAFSGPTPSRPGIIPYLTAGYPAGDATVPLLLACQRGGALAAEVGIPFSDPLADGPTVQRSGTRALELGMTPARALAQVAEARAAGLSIPVAVMSYVNPILAMGTASFVDACAESGVDGVIATDLPAEEAADLAAALSRRRLCHIPLVAPTTSAERIRHVAASASGFVYCVAVIGTTGARSEVQSRAIDLLVRVRSVSALPRALGFGISRPEHVAALAGRCEAVAVGSALLDAVAAADESEAELVVESFVRHLREG